MARQVKDRCRRGPESRFGQRGGVPGLYRVRLHDMSVKGQVWGSSETGVEGREGMQVGERERGKGREGYHLIPVMVTNLPFSFYLSTRLFISFIYCVFW